MALPLEQIDTSLIEELMGLKRDVEALRARLALMAAEADKVSAPVFQRVHADYQARLQALDEQAAPKKDQARREYAKLRLLLDEAGGRRDAALLDQEELEFRHRLGEFEEADFTARSGELAQRIAELEHELAAVTAVRGRFLAAFDSETELAQVPAPPAAGAPAGEVLSAIEPAVPAAAASPEEAALSPMSFGTVILTARGKPEAAGPLGATMIVSFGRLVSLEEGPAAMEFRVQPLTTIGRTRHSDVQVDAPSVSRKHAEIALTESGYVVRDLGSENGTFVNGERIAEHPLIDGDLLHFGGVGFSFHTS
jgi:FHA domain